MTDQKAQEDAKQPEEEERKRKEAEESKRKADEEAARIKAEQEKTQKEEEERKRKEAEEAARIKAEQEKKQKDEEERKRKEAEEAERLRIETEKKQKEEEERKRKEEEVKSHELYIQLKKEYDILRKERDLSYVRNEVIECKSNTEVVMRSDVKEKQININHGMAEHKNRLMEWNGYSDNLQKEFEKDNNIKSVVSDEGIMDTNDGDEKEETMDIRVLLDSYINCMKLVYEQELRSDDVGDYIQKLNKSKKGLKDTLIMYNKNVPMTEEVYGKLCNNYNELRKQREDLQSKVEAMMKEINSITEQENTVNHEKCQTLDNLNELKLEMSKYEIILTDSKKLTTDYQQFECNVDDKKMELLRYFEQIWMQHEQKWSKWNINDIICWIKYLMHCGLVHLSSDADLVEIEKEMNVQKINGELLEGMDKGDIKRLGFNVYKDYQQIYTKIRELVETYPKSGNYGMGDTRKGKEAKIQIPDEYKCPISGDIMKDPVIAADNKTYERVNIIKYIEENKKFPGSNETESERYDMDDWMCKNKKLKKKIDVFLSVNPQFTTEGIVNVD